MILDFLVEEKEIDNMITMYHVSDKNFDKFKPNAQGIHLTSSFEDLDDIAKAKKLNPIIKYKVNIENNLSSPKVSIDAVYWDAVNISKHILAGNIEISNLSKQDMAILNMYKDKNIDTVTYKSDYVDLLNVKRIFTNHGYNCIIYPNKVENGKPVMLFDDKLIKYPIEII